MEIIGQNVTIFTDIKNLQILCEKLLSTDIISNIVEKSTCFILNRFFLMHIKCDIKSADGNYLDRMFTIFTDINNLQIL